MLLRMPKIGMEMTEAVLARWLAPDGAVVEKGQPLYELETDKVTNEVEAPATGRLRRLAEEGVTYLVGDPVAELDDPAGQPITYS
jgi:pyruvate/2-oxoglutarate dehydrogenase complex dihydrolipoamide acyltransferase (E2) component